MGEERHLIENGAADEDLDELQSASELHVVVSAVSPPTPVERESEINALRDDHGNPVYEEEAGNAGWYTYRTAHIDTGREFNGSSYEAET